MNVREHFEKGMKNVDVIAYRQDYKDLQEASKSGATHTLTVKAKDVKAALQGIRLAEETIGISIIVEVKPWK